MSRWVFFFIFCLSFTGETLRAEAEAPPAFELIEDLAKVPVLTPNLKERQLRKLRLANGVEVYMISDPNARQSAAAMSVEVGAWSDPEGFPGMAHFCEHMLFMGTSKYPDEASYDAFMTANGGQRNAYTTDDHTNYMFSVNHEAYEEALDRFSYFFKEPTFNASAVAREMRAVDQEHAKSVETDIYRSYHVTKQLGNPDHPFSRFRTGTYETLQRISREQLMDWYRSHYSSNLMNLVVYSNRSLDELQDMVLEKFSAIPNQEKSIYRNEAPLLSNNYAAHLSTVTPVKDLRSLSISWEFPKEFAHMREANPSDVISYILGHEGEESLLAQLKREKLAESLMAGGYHNGQDNIAFYIKIGLTREGVSRWETVAERTFQMIKRLQETGVTQQLFDEAKQMAKLGYQYASRKSPYHMVTEHARSLLYEKLETYPEWTEIPQRFKPEAVQDFLQLMTVDRAYFMLIARPELTGIKPDRVEEWTGAEWAIRPINEETLQTWKESTAHSKMAAPRPNPLLPEKLELAYPELKDYKAVPQPTVLEDSERGLVYFLGDEYYGVPKVNWSFEIKTPAVDPRKPESQVLADLYSRSVSEALNAYSYYALMAGLGYDFAPTDNGFKVSISGYSDKALRLFQEVLRVLPAVEPDEQQFAIYKNSTRRAYENADKAGPLQQAAEGVRSLLYRYYIPNAKKAKIARKVTREHLLNFRDTVFETSYVEGLIVGNLSQADAQIVWETLRDSLASSPFPKEDQLKPKTISLPEHHGPYYVKEKTKQQGNAIMLMIQNGPATLQERAAQDILSNAMEQPFYSELRSKQQTGYIVFNYGKDVERQLYTLFGVQSNSHNVRDLLARFELAIESFLREMDKGGFPKEKFEEYKASWLAQLEQPPKNQAELTQVLRVLAFDFDGDFERINKRIKSFQDLSYEEFVAFARESHGRQNRRRVAVLVNGETPEDDSLDYSPMRAITQVRKVSDYVSKDDSF